MVKQVSQHWYTICWRTLGESSAYIGTNGFGKNDAEPVYFGNTTPDVVTLHNQIGELRRDNIKKPSIEASSHAMALGRIYNVDIDVAIFTNLTHEHFRFSMGICKLMPMIRVYYFQH